MTLISAQPYARIQVLEEVLTFMEVMENTYGVIHPVFGMENGELEQAYLHL